MSNCSLSLCEDCFSYNEISELDSFYYTYGDEKGEEKVEEVGAAWGQLEEEYKGLAIFYSGEESDEEFSTSSCDCCGSSLAGKRYGYNVTDIRKQA